NDGYAGSVELHTSPTGRCVRVSPQEAARLQVLEGVPIERHRLPFTLQDGSEWDVVCDLARVPIHAPTDVVGVVPVIVGPQVAGVAKSQPNVFAAQLQSCLGDTITKLRIQQRQT